MPTDGARNLQEERHQEAIPQRSDSSQDPNDGKGTPTSLFTSANQTSGSSHSGTLTLPNRSAIEATSGSATFTKDIDIPRNVIQSTGDPFVIEVVPDTRFPLYTLTEYVQRTYSNFDFSPFSMVSPASLVGYLVYMIHAFIFLIDVYETPTMSAYAEEVDTTHALRKLVDLFSNAFIPDVVFEILQSMLPHRLDIRSKLELYTTYGSVLFNYDAPRLPPPSMFLLAHNQLISQTRTLAAYKNWLAQDLISYGGKMYRVANFTGSLYQTQTGQATTSYLYRNWLARSLFRLADSATHRTHLRRPDILDFDYSIPRVDGDSYNPYIHLLMLEPAHRVTTRNFISSLSDFCRDELHAKRSLFSLISQRQSSISRHVIQGPTAPTWHTQDILDLDPDSNLRSGTFQGFCEVARFGRPKPANPGNVQLPYPEDPAAIQKELYLVQEHDKDSKFDPITADEELHTEGMNLLFDPYDDEPSAHYSTVISGKLIQNSNIDGQTLILPNPIDALPKTNSRYLQGAVPLKHIVPEFDGSTIYLYPRFPRTGRSQSLFSTLFNAGQAWIPIFKQRIAAIPTLIHFSRNDGADGIIPSTNVICTPDHTKVPDLGKQVLLWSSYRHRRGSERPTEDTVYFYATLELLFGTRSSIMQTYNLHQLLPLN